MHDPVNHPHHYADSCSIECIDAMAIFLGAEGIVNFCIGNAFKYIWRCDNKNNKEEDLKKATWYLDKADFFLGSSSFDIDNEKVHHDHIEYMRYLIQVLSDTQATHIK